MYISVQLAISLPYEIPVNCDESILLKYAIVSPEAFSIDQRRVSRFV